VINYGVHDLNKWSINYNTNYQFDENVYIANDNQVHYFGYYDALNNSNVYARMVGTSNDAVWENGYEFNFPWTLNQSILLESSLKTKAFKSMRDWTKDNSTEAQLKIKTQERPYLRTRNAHSLINR